MSEAFDRALFIGGAFMKSQCYVNTYGIVYINQCRAVYASFAYWLFMLFNIRHVALLQLIHGNVFSQDNRKSLLLESDGLTNITLKISVIGIGLK